MSSERLNGTLSLHFVRELHGHLRATVSDGAIKGTLRTREGSFPVSGSIDRIVSLSLQLPDGEARIQFGKDLEHSGGTGTYKGQTCEAAYVPTPIKQPPTLSPGRIGTFYVL